MAFTEAQLKNLEAKLDAKYVRTRRAHDTTLAYVEGWHVIAEANRIFGYDAWDRHTLSTRCVWSGAASHHFAAAYTAKVRIAVRAGSLTITREGCGSGEAKAPTPGEAHELALKAAETDATKRALATFGNPFGLALYDRELAGVKNRKALISGCEMNIVARGCSASLTELVKVSARRMNLLSRSERRLPTPRISSSCSPFGSATSMLYAQSTNRPVAQRHAGRYRSKSRCAYERSRHRLGQTRWPSSPASTCRSERRLAPRSTRAFSPYPSRSVSVPRSIYALLQPSHASSVGVLLLTRITSVMRNRKVWLLKSAMNSPCPFAPSTTARITPPAMRGDGGRSAKSILFP